MEFARRGSREGCTYAGDTEQQVFGGLRRGLFGRRQGSWWTFRGLTGNLSKPERLLLDV